MTPWNYMNVFRLRDSGVAGPDAPSAFDPTRTGDPLTAATGMVGRGHVGHGEGATLDLPRRNPIGFGPPAEVEQPAPTRYRTEISFKRHQAPASSTRSTSRFETPGETRGAGPAEPTWGGQASETVAASGASYDVFASTGGTGDDDAQVGHAEAATEDNVPFYKRELSFRRRKKDTVEEPEEAVENVPTVEVTPAAVADEPASEAPDEQPEAIAVAPAGELDAVAEVESSPAEEPADEHPLVEPEPVADAVGHVTEEQEPVAEMAEAVPATSDWDDAVVADEQPAPFADGSDDVELAADASDEVDETVAEELEAPAETVPELPVAAAVEVEEQNGRGRFSRRKGDKEPSPRRKRGSRSGGGKVVGLKIGASQIAAAVVSDNDGKAELVELARRPLEAGVVVDGEVRDADALSHALKSFFDEHKLPRKNVRIGLASNRIGVRTLDIVGIDDDVRFDNAVRFKAHEVLPVAVSESVLDYRILDERPNEAGEPLRRVLLVVAPRDQVEPYVDVAARAGIQLEGIDLEALALLRAFVEPRPFATRALDDTATVVVSIGHESTTLLVAGGGACEFTRVFDWGGATLQNAIAEELDLPQLEAATVLRHLSLIGPGRQLDTLDDAARAGALDAVRQRLTPFAREFVSSLQFYQTQPESLGIGEILLTGGTSHLEGLADALHQMIGVDVRAGDPLGRVTVATEIAASVDATIGSMAVPIGLGIQDDRMRGVDLLPKDARDAARKRPNLVTVAAPVAVAVPIVALGLLFTSAYGSASDSQSELDALEAQIAALPEPVVPQIDAALQGAQAQRALAVANVLGGRVAWDAVLNDLARVLPENVWLNELSATQPPPPVAVAEGSEEAPAAAAVASAPSGVVIDGFTYSQPDVARLLARLAALRSLSGVTLQSTAREEIGEKPVYHFTIVASLNETGGTP